MSDFYYMDVTLEVKREKDSRVSATYFKNHMIECLKTMFGEVGASTSIDLLKYEESSRRAIVRCSSDSYVKLRTSLTLSNEYNEKPCMYMINKTSPCLLSLLGNSRTYKHT